MTDRWYFLNFCTSWRTNRNSCISPYILECPAEGPNPLKGDLLVFGGATLYAVSNVTEVSANPQLSALQFLNNMTEVYMCAILIYAFFVYKISGVYCQERQQSWADGDARCFRSSYKCYTDVSFGLMISWVARFLFPWLLSSVVLQLWQIKVPNQDFVSELTCLHRSIMLDDMILLAWQILLKSYVY
jgi:hypothetical protein